ncbi:unnamed protein product [Aphanomyces euteiches]
MRLLLALGLLALTAASGLSTETRQLAQLSQEQGGGNVALGQPKHRQRRRPSGLHGKTIRRNIRKPIPDSAISDSPISESVRQKIEDNNRVGRKGRLTPLSPTTQLTIGLKLPPQPKGHEKRPLPRSVGYTNPGYSRFRPSPTKKSGDDRVRGVLSKASACVYGCFTSKTKA